jgi:hypothetical protein
MRHKFRLLFVSLFILILGGCQGFLAVEGASAIFSGKTASDHVVSFVSGKDCSIVYTEQGNAYCVEDEMQVLQPKLYCYKTLASVSCYTQPDPGRTPDQIVGGDELTSNP